MLAVSPFTAPFSTCDLSVMLTAAPAAGQGFIERSPSIEHGEQQSSGVSILTEDQFNDVSLTATSGSVPEFVDAVRVSTSAPPASVVRSPLLTLRL